MALTPEEQAQQLSDLTKLSTDAAKAQETLGDVSQKLGNTFESLAKKIGVSLDQLENLEDLSDLNTDRVALLVSGTIKLREAFTGLNNVDFGNLSTFTSQANDLKEALFSGGTAAAKAAQAVEDMATKMKSSGVAPELLERAIKKGKEAVIDLYTNMMVGADNSLRLQRSIFQLAGQTGQLDDVFKAAGETMVGGVAHFGRLNEMTQIYTKSILDSMDATGLSAAQVEKYFGELSAVPGAMTATVKGGSGMSQNFSMLTATLNYATGAGRKMEDVIEDMKTAFRDYNLTGEDALRFTARMGEIANKFHVEISDVQGALKGTADAFKMFGNESEGAAKMLNEYVGALEKTKLSGHAAIEVVQGLIGGIKGMDIAQKAFLSAQTGGPGGLMGAFQIEKLLREGKIDEVFEKVRQQMTKQFGQIVTLEEASKSPQAAAALTKQMMILRQGPLGQFAKDDQSAIRLLEAFRSKAEGRPGALTPDQLSGTIVKDKMAEGTEIQKMSYTELTKIRNRIEGLRYFAGAGNLDLIQKTMTASAGHTEDVSEATEELRTSLDENMKAADTGRRESSKNLATDLARQIQTTSQRGAGAVGGFVGLHHGFRAAIEAPARKFAEIVKGKETREQIEARDKAAMDEKIMEARMGQFVGNVPGINVPDLEEAATAGSAERASAPPGAVAARAGAAVAPNKLGEIVVNIEGLCIECGEKMRGTAQSFAVNTGQKARR